ncbi:MAG: hypothetical protein PHX93_00820 [Candidatus Peribacteraceae bacterium]|jgi:hypothetical protein|nr:hypothetical protein [Candidatus Peribacteraceae bacterium]
MIRLHHSSIGESRLTRKNEPNKPSAYREGFPRGEVPGSPEAQSPKRVEKPAGILLYELFKRERSAKRRKEKIERQIARHIRDLDQEIDKKPALERLPLFDKKTTKIHELNNFRGLYERIIDQYKLNLNEAERTPGAARDPLEKCAGFISQMEAELADWETKVGLEAEKPPASEWVPPQGERERMPSSHVFDIPFGHPDARGQRGRNERIIISFSATGWEGNNLTALRNVPGNEGAENLVLPQSIMLNNLPMESNPFTQVGTAGSRLNAIEQERKQEDTHRRALEQAGVNVARTLDGTRIEVTYVPEGAWVQVEGYPKIFGTKPSSRAKVPAAPVPSQPAPAARERPAPRLPRSSGERANERPRLRGLLGRIAAIAGQDPAARQACEYLRGQMDAGTFRWASREHRDADRIIRGLLSGRFSPRAVNGVAPRNIGSLRHFIDMVLASGESREEVVSAQPAQRGSSRTRPAPSPGSGSLSGSAADKPAATPPVASGLLGGLGRLAERWMGKAWEFWNKDALRKTIARFSAPSSAAPATPKAPQSAPAKPEAKPIVPAPAAEESAEKKSVGSADSVPSTEAPAPEPEKLEKTIERRLEKIKGEIRELTDDERGKIAERGLQFSWQRQGIDAWNGADAFRGERKGKVANAIDAVTQSWSRWRDVPGGEGDKRARAVLALIDAATDENLARSIGVVFFEVNEPAFVWPPDLDLFPAPAETSSSPTGQPLDEILRDAEQINSRSKKEKGR